jgi:hypothetical protein
MSTKKCQPDFVGRGWFGRAGGYVQYLLSTKVLVIDKSTCHRQKYLSSTKVLVIDKSTCHRQKYLSSTKVLSYRQKSTFLSTKLL